MAQIFASPRGVYTRLGLSLSSSLKRACCASSSPPWSLSTGRRGRAPEQDRGRRRRGYRGRDRPAHALALQPADDGAARQRPPKVGRPKPSYVARPLCLSGPARPPSLLSLLFPRPPSSASGAASRRFCPSRGASRHGRMPLRRRRPRLPSCRRRRDHLREKESRAVRPHALSYLHSRHVSSGLPNDGDATSTFPRIFGYFDVHFVRFTIFHRLQWSVSH